MKTIERAKRCKHIADELMKINQASYVRDENLNPIHVNWDLDKHSELFHGLLNLQDELYYIIQALSQL